MDLSRIKAGIKERKDGNENRTRTALEKKVCRQKKKMNSFRWKTGANEVRSKSGNV